MTCWRCGRVVNNPHDILAPGAIGAHADWCSDGTPNDCDHCGGNPCRWWCLGEKNSNSLNAGMPPWSDRPAYHRERYRRIRAGEWVFA